MRYLYIRHNASIMAMSIICPPEGPLDWVPVPVQYLQGARSGADEGHSLTPASKHLAPDLADTAVQPESSGDDPISLVRASVAGIGTGQDRASRVDALDASFCSFTSTGTEADCSRSHALTSAQSQ